MAAGNDKEDLYSTLMDISDTIRDKALSIHENDEPKSKHWVVKLQKQCQ